MKLKDANSSLFGCIAGIRFIFAFLVVVFHTFAILSNSYYGNYTGFKLMNHLVGAFLSDLIVPVYFFISGYLFFIKKWSWRNYFEKVKRRVNTLFVPYLLWNALAIFLLVLKQLPCFSSFLSVPNTNLDFSFHNILSCFWMYDGRLNSPPLGTDNYEVYVERQYYPINTALWYIRDLMIVILCTPVLQYFIRKYKFKFIAILGIAYWFVFFHYIDWHLNQLLSGFLFFSFGAYFSLHKLDILKTFGRMFKLSLILYTFCSLLSFYTVGYSCILDSTLKLINSFAIIIFSFNMVSILFSRKSLSEKIYNELSVWGCFVYMSHCLVLSRILKILRLLLCPETDAMMLFYIFSGILITLMILTIIYIMLHYYFRPILKILVGRV